MEGLALSPCKTTTIFYVQIKYIYRYANVQYNTCIHSVLYSLISKGQVSISVSNNLLVGIERYNNTGRSFDVSYPKMTGGTIKKVTQTGRVRG